MHDTVPGHLRVMLASLVGLAALVLASGLLSLPTGTSELADRVLANMEESGVEHQVTAVLLNFRSYDTMLEIGVLLLAVVGVWSLGSVWPDPATLAPTGPVLGAVRRALLPMLLLASGYLLWIGTSAPGGAFQAGAILATGGVLAMLTGWRPVASLRPLIEGGLALALLVFIGVAAGTLFYAGVLLAYPSEWAGSLILLIEVVATVSIGLALAALYLGGSPAGWREFGDPGEE